MNCRIAKKSSPSFLATYQINVKEHLLKSHQGEVFLINEHNDRLQIALWVFYLFANTLSSQNEISVSNTNLVLAKSVPTWSPGFQRGNLRAHARTSHRTLFDRD